MKEARPAAGGKELTEEAGMPEELLVGIWLLDMVAGGFGCGYCWKSFVVRNERAGDSWLYLLEAALDGGMM